MERDRMIILLQASHFEAAQALEYSIRELCAVRDQSAAGEDAAPMEVQTGC